MKKKLSKFILRKIDVEQSDILNKRDLKHILGGYGEYPDFMCIQCWCTNEYMQRSSSSFMVCGEGEDRAWIKDNSCAGHAGIACTPVDGDY